ncbi:P-loop NTPase fold protein [Marinobacter sp. S0848L]|uniref:KAP family P-loop NTPase fold protein n=1 Tax=Marinobacter sp. S0848L TaxID=2926423 RepID=UPI001FF2B6A4|nr:P-loop NTPase fold protein [Marinobacter sp. S0848L]MCK0106842.1 P-loop NTPase fold protein [Marinobacter sp. S0848L]
MRFEPQKLEIEDNDPWASSAFELSDTGERLTNLVKQAEGPAVISLTAAWGTGKTSFLDMWSASLRSQGAKVVKFSAWEVDYTHDALVALIQELSGQLTDDDDSESPSIEQIKAKGGELLRHVAPLAVRVLTGGIVDINGVDDLAAKLVEKKLADHENAKHSAARFRDSLTEFAKKLEDEGNEFPLVIIVDELDRCRPNYAVELLESIKHFFNVDGVVFVIGVDIDQLGETIKGHYGQGYDGHRYLNKFFHLQLTLPEPDLEQFCLNTIHRLGMESIFEGRGLSNSEGNAFSADFIARLAKSYNLSMREIERLLMESGAVYASNSQLPPLLSRVILWLLVQKQRNASIFESLLNKKISAAEAWEHICPHTKLIFRESFHEEGYFRAVITLLLEGQGGISSLKQSAQQRVEEDNASPSQVDYWMPVLTAATELSNSRFRSNYMNMVGATISLLGYRSSRDDAPYGH